MTLKLDGRHTCTGSSWGSSGPDLFSGLKGFPPVQIDHRGHDTLNNRRRNLRVVDHSRNQMNSVARVRSSQLKGVSWDSTCEKWRTTIQVAGEQKFLGRFDNEEAAGLPTMQQLVKRSANSPYAISRRLPPNPDPLSDATSGSVVQSIHIAARLR